MQRTLRERTEIESDFEQLYLETRLFKEDRHVLTDRSEYRKVNNRWIIPTKNARTHYSELPSGIRYQITEVENHFSYQVTSRNGNILVNDNSPFNIAITLNATKDHIHIHFSTPIEGLVQVQIKDAANIVVQEHTQHVGGNMLIIDINDLAAGMYTIVCTHEDNEAQAHFIKEGIGQYDESDPTEMTVQIVPNPATHEINVRFPIAINRDM